MIRPPDLDADWFGDILQGRFPGARVADVEHTRVDEWTNLHVRATLSYDDRPDGAPTHVFVKLSPTDEDKARGLGSAHMGAQEAWFYLHLAPELDLRVPEPYGAVVEDDGGFAIVVEDFAHTGCAPHNMVGVGADEAAVALEDLAGMHVRFESAEARKADCVNWIKEPRLPPPEMDQLPPNLGSKLLAKGIEAQPQRLGEAYVATAESWIAHGGWFQRLWWAAPYTVIHGDAHPGNLFDDHGRIGFLDWGLVGLGDPLRDVSYFVDIALDTEVRRSNGEELFRHYLDVCRGLGGREITFDDAWERHRLHAAYLAPASCQALDIPDDASAGARRFSDLFLDRCIAAIEDLDVPAAVAAARSR